MRLGRERRAGGRPASVVGRHARRTAVLATLVACVVYLGAAALADAVVLRHFGDLVDARLSARLAELARSAPLSHLGGPPPAGYRRPGGGGDPDDAPVFAWWLAAGSRAPVALESGDPALATVPGAVAGAVEATVAGHPFRFATAAASGGRLFVATSLTQLDDVRTTLLSLEGALLPLLLLMFFVVADVIGRGAAAPIERARQEQLDFTADASHELRTPLAVIEAETGLALSAPRDAGSYRAALENVAGESRRLRRIVDDLLWLARLDSLPAAPPPQEVDLGTLLEGAARRFAPVAARRSISLSAAASSEFPLVEGPADWLDRLVSVLVDNACRYVEEGGTIGLSATVERGRTVLRVDDSGPGIPGPERRRVLRRFHRSSPVAGGAGLGLSIADAIVRGTAGEIRLLESPAGGARVEVSWPVRRPGEARRHEPAPRHPAVTLHGAGPQRPPARRP